MIGQPEQLTRNMIGSISQNKQLRMKKAGASLSSCDQFCGVVIEKFAFFCEEMVILLSYRE